MSSTRELAPQSDALVGRDGAVAELVDALAPGRLVTLTGPAGVGKTRLARDVRAAISGRTCYWVDLTEDVEPSMPDAVAHALGLTAVAEQDVSRRLFERLLDDPAVLVLDNCEHVIDAVADFVDRLRSRCPQLSVLATSRERLDLRGELTVPLAPLAVPRSETDLDEIAASPAVQLLVQRAGQVRPGFRLTAEAAPAAARICRRLDGLPLSIELAASWLRALTMQQVSDGLGDVFSLLGRRGRRGGGRHGSVVAALDWSHRLLDADEQRLFRRLGVFPSTFTLDGVTAVGTTGPGPVSPDLVLALLARLIDTSLVTVTHGGPTARYRMLYVVREYAREKLAAAGEGAATAAAHQRHYAAVVAHEAAAIGRRGEAQALHRLDAELDNLDAAVRYTAQAGPPETALELATSLWRFCYLRGHYRRGRDWLELLHPLADGVELGSRRATMLHGAGMLAFLQCDYTPATRAFDAALTLFRESGDPAGTADCLLALAGVAREQARYDRAHDLYEDAVAIGAEQGLAAVVARARNYQAFLAWLRTDADAADRLGRQALDELTTLGDHEGTCWAWLNLGCAALLRDDLGAAADAFDESQRIAEAISFREGTAWLRHVRGLLALRHGSAGAAAMLRDALARHRALGDRWRTASVLADLATAYVAEHPRGSAVLLGRADALWAEIGSTPAPYERPAQDAARAAAAAALGESAFASAWRAGRAAQPDITLDGEVSDPSEHQESPPPPPSGPRPSNGSGPRSSPEGSSPSLEILALGSARVRLEGRPLVTADWGYAKPRDLLFLLACSPPLGKEQIGAHLWPDLDPRRLRNALHSALRDLRKTLGDPGWVVYTDGRYALDLDHRPCRFDVADFEAALAAARAGGSPDATQRQLHRAVETYRGDLLPDLDADWVVTRREELRRAYVRATLELGRELSQRGDFDRAATMFALAVDRDPFLEVAHRGLMLSWARSGEPARAVEHFQQLARRLKHELGAVPAPETQLLYRRLVSHPPT